jgi:hypothetical protein
MLGDGTATLRMLIVAAALLYQSAEFSFALFLALTGLLRAGLSTLLLEM